MHTRFRPRTTYRLLRLLGTATCHCYKRHVIATIWLATGTCLLLFLGGGSEMRSKTKTMATTPIGAMLTVFGTQSSNFGCSCEHHTICGAMVGQDTLLRFQKRTVAKGKANVLKSNFDFAYFTHFPFSFQTPLTQATILSWQLCGLKITCWARMYSLWSIRASTVQRLGFPTTTKFQQDCMAFTPAHQAPQLWWYRVW